MLETLTRPSHEVSRVPLHPLYVPILSGTLGGGVLGGLVVPGMAGFFFKLPPFMQDRWQMALLCAAIGAALGLLLGWINWRRWHQRKQFAEQQSLHYSKKLPTAFADRLQIKLNRGGRVTVANAMHGIVADVRLLAADMVHVPPNSGDGGSQRVVRHMFCFEADDLGLPQFTLQPEGMLLNMMTGILGVEDIDFAEHAQFSQAYHLNGLAPEAVRQLFQGPILEYFGEHGRWEVRGEGQLLTMVYRRRTGSVAKFRQLHEEAAEIFALFREAAGEVSSMQPPVRPTAPRKTGGLLGGAMKFSRVTQDEVWSFFREEPPRHVPRHFTGSRFNLLNFGYLFGGFMIVIGLFFFLLGVIFLQAPQPNVIPVLIGVGVITAGSLVIGSIRWWRARRLSLFRHGRYTTGQIESVERTSVSVNEQIRYRVRVKYDHFGSPRVTTHHLYGWAAEQAIAATDDQREIALLVDPTERGRILLDLELIVDAPVRV